MILITGGKGQLGEELHRLLSERKLRHVAPGSKELDITNRKETHAYIKKINPKVIFHCAAYTAVDKAEDEGKERNRLVNIQGTKHVAEIAEEIGAIMIYISTDYVFDGTNKCEYTVDAQVNPKNEYGLAKLQGEEVVKAICSKWYIVRTSWVFGEFDHNFVHTMRRLAETHSNLSVVSDQIGRPTWTRTLSEFLLHLIETKSEYGVYHLSNDESCSWYDFATEILKDTDVNINPVTSEEYPQKAYRPKHSVMDLGKAKSTGFVIPTWKEALKQFTEYI